MLLPRQVKVDLGIWGRLTAGGHRHVVAAVAILILIGLTYLPLIHQNERMRSEVMRLDTELQKQETTSKELRAEIEALRHDPASVARLVRETLNYAKTDETVIRFETNNPNGSVSH